MTYDDWKDACARGAYVMHRGKMFRLIGYTDRPTITAQPADGSGETESYNLCLSFSPNTPYADDFTAVPTIIEAKP